MKEGRNGGGRRSIERQKYHVDSELQQKREIGLSHMAS